MARRNHFPIWIGIDGDLEVIPQKSIVLGDEAIFAFTFARAKRDNASKCRDSLTGLANDRSRGYL